MSPAQFNSASYPQSGGKLVVVYGYRVAVADWGSGMSACWGIDQNGPLARDKSKMAPLGHFSQPKRPRQRSKTAQV